MKRDKDLLTLIKNEEISIPNDLSSKIDNTLSELCENDNKRHRFTLLKATLPVLISVVALFLILPNINSNIAFAMQKIPVIGNLVKVITVHEYKNNNEFHPENVEIPNIYYDGETENLINADIKQLTNTAIERFQEECKNLPDSHSGLVIDYETVTNTDDWFTLRILIYHDAGSGYPSYKFYHINKKTGETANLSTLFNDEFDYINIFSKNIYNQMIEKNEELGETVYWVDDVEVPDWEFGRIDTQQNFYFDEYGNIVIVFDKYQVAPGYMGNPEFVITVDVFSSYLK